MSSNAGQKNISCQCFSTKCGDSGPNLHIVASWSPTDPLQGKERTCCGTGIIHPPDIENSEGWSIAGIPPLSDLPSSPYSFSESTRGSVPCSCWRSSTYFPFASGTTGDSQGERGASTGHSRHHRPQLLDFWLQPWQLAFRILYISCTEYVFWKMNQSPWCEGRHIEYCAWKDIRWSGLTRVWTDLKARRTELLCAARSHPPPLSFPFLPRWKCLLLKLFLT